MVEHAAITSSSGHGCFTRTHSRKSNFLVVWIRVLALEGHCYILEALALPWERTAGGNLIEQFKACAATVRTAWWSSLRSLVRKVFLCKKREKCQEKHREKTQFVASTTRDGREVSSMSLTEMIGFFLRTHATSKVVCV